MNDEPSRFAGELFGLDDLTGGFDLAELARMRADKMIPRTGASLMRGFYDIEPEESDPRLMVKPAGWDGTQPEMAFGR